ncbi:hypothetical protein HPB52_021587 [Rhipicephalus sanguineus]|uniref:Uncharacterized protein n=1 Tax=Rhipicephalus sanguineus TaxID=34632 RepID=A0A9D4T337_RHISA|nr:hypothetical protein HPB52_021587 [Rhipicephalus sanguineus]
MLRSTADHHELYTPRDAMIAPLSAPWQPAISAVAVEHSPAPQSRVTTRVPAPRYDRRAQRTPPRRPTYRYDIPDEPIRYTRANDLLMSLIAIRVCEARVASWYAKRGLCPPDLQFICGLLQQSVGHCRRLRRILSSEWWRQEVKECCSGSDCVDLRQS